MSALEASHAESAEAIRGMASDVRRQTETSSQMLDVLREINDRAEKRDGPILDAAARALAAQTEASAQQASAVGKLWEAAGSRAGIAVITALVVALAQMLGLPMPRLSLDPAGPPSTVALQPATPENESATHLPPATHATDPAADVAPAPAPEAIPAGEPAPMGE
jgi:hypothetical protein